MTRLLASVADLDELALAAAGGADILDLKDPTAGALGAWPLERIAEAVALVRARPLSATIGDLPMDPARVAARVAETHALGVDFVKIGLTPDGDPAGCITALAAQAHHGVRLVAVLFADLWPDFRLLDAVARAGFAGAMLDTAGKVSGALLRHKDLGTVARFVVDAHRLGLLTGLAGSLTLADVPALLPLGPDYLGFRTALCAGGNRRGVLDPAALAAVRLSIPPSGTTAPIPAWTAAGTPWSPHHPD
ncbi:(5-formylfuran-3-yl)methyl phosphate synthase [Azospirillum sp.]|uniref:(5-formylfuran-3-yl)methyl phosphate synthase n=1 Tax=Azospirillum sp. TaxID=34012 RepID=UPI002D6D726B|nr:(5-formylfuran-3-yl)methyl phosphate synthase [Azospirillum sp.]HYD65583.1 (5-formylfuran-3-yl)methyl phosphate synthase [Azospirillum sp.]